MILLDKKTVVFRILALCPILIFGCGKAPSSAPPTTHSPPQHKIEVTTKTTIEYKQHSVEISYPHQVKPKLSGTTYSIWVRSFKDSNNDGAGDLKGITEKLGYLSSLGIKQILISPITSSPSYHGYDTTDHLSINGDFGQMHDLETLISEAKARDIEIFMDISINQVSEYHPWFIGAMNDSNEKKKFIWREAIPEGYHYPWANSGKPEEVWHTKNKGEDWYYAVFGWTQPDLDHTNPVVQSYISGMLEHYLNIGIGGFRIDAARYLIEEDQITADSASNQEYIKNLIQGLKSTHSHSIFLTEVFSDNTTLKKYLNKDIGVDGNFLFDFQKVVVGGLRSLESETPIKSELVYEGIKSDLTKLLVDLANNEAPLSHYISFLGSHDFHRYPQLLNNEPNRIKAALSLLFTMPFSPMLYYGDEIGMGQFTNNDDLYQRSIMQWEDAPDMGFNSTGEFWTDEKKWFWWKEQHSPWVKKWYSSIAHSGSFVEPQQNNANSILSHVKKLISARDISGFANSPNHIEIYKINNPVWLVKYTFSNRHYLTIINLDPTIEHVVLKRPEFAKEYLDHFSNGNIIKFDRPIKIQGNQVMILESL